MKKITLLFTILCAGQLYGMEEPPKMGAFGDLPEDVHKVIVQSLATSNNLEQTIEAIKVAGALQGVRYDNLKDFTKLVHILAKKFSVPTEKVATVFKTPTSLKYLEMINNETLRYMEGDVLNELNQLIKNGLDVNATYRYMNSPSLLDQMVNQEAKPEIIKLLLDAGANPHYKDDNEMTALDYAKALGDDDNAIVKLLEEAMQK